MILILASATAVSAFAWYAARARDVPKVATGFAHHRIRLERQLSGDKLPYKASEPCGRI
jgi:hypothetical protein